MKTAERAFERVLWNSRLVVLVAVVASLVIAVGLMAITSVDVATLVGQFVSYFDPDLNTETRAGMRLEMLAKIVGAIDGYLLAGVLLIFGLGLYELFIGKIDQIEQSEFAGRLLLVRSLDDLKNRLARVILLILMVKFLQQTLRMKFDSPLELLYLALGIALVGTALLLSNLKADH